MINPLKLKLKNFVHLESEDEDLLDRIIVRSRVILAGADLISEGEKPRDVHLILKGFACRYKLLSDGRRQIVSYLVPGDLCDLHGFLLESMDHSLGTMSRCEVADLSRSAILQLLARPAIAQGLLLSAMVDEGILREWLVNLGQRRAEQRVAHFLCELLARLRVIGLVSENTFSFPITQVELADTMAVTPVHMNRTLQVLRSKGLVAFEAKRLTVLDVKALEREAGWNPNYLHFRREAKVDLPDAVTS